MSCVSAGECGQACMSFVSFVCVYCTMISGNCLNPEIIKALAPGLMNLRQLTELDMTGE